MSEQDKVSQYLTELRSLIHRACRDEVVLEVRLEPMQPLRMGGYVMVPHVRPAREKAK